MPELGKHLGKDLGTNLATDLAGVLLLYSNATYTNSDPHYLIDPLTPQVLGPFAANVPPTFNYGGRKYARVFEPRTEQYTESQDISDVDWDKVRLISPTAQTDPVGGSTAWKLIPNTTPAQNHYVQQQLSYDGSSKYTIYCIAKSAGYGGLRLSFSTDAFPDNCVARFNLDAGTVGTKDAGFLTSSILSLGNGWYLCSATAQSDAAANSWSHIVVLQADETENFAGDGSSGIIVWNPQVEKGAYPSPPIKTEATAVTRPKDQLYWPAAVVSAAIKSGLWKVNLVPGWAHDEESGNKYVCALGANDYLRWNGTNDKFEIYAGGVQKIQSGALTFTRNKHLTLAINAAAGTLQVSGTDTGDSTEPGTAYTWPDATDLDWLQDSTDANQFNGYGSEPYR